MSKASRDAAYGKVQDKILEIMARGVLPWDKGLRASGMAHRGLESKTPYRGVNAIMTGCQGYGSPYWVTFKKAQKLGGRVKKGEKGTPIVHAKPVEKRDPTTDEVTARWMSLRYWTVFNLEQCEGIEAPTVESDSAPVVEPSQACLDLIAGYTQPTVVQVDHPQTACYSPERDTITIASSKHYKTPEMWFKTMAHEMAHSTGYRTRLDREGVVNPVRFGSHTYSEEEMIAEFAAAFLAAEAGVSPPTIENSASYIAGWAKKVKSDPKLVVKAAGMAQRAADWVTGVNRKG